MPLYNTKSKIIMCTTNHNHCSSSHFDPSSNNKLQNHMRSLQTTVKTEPFYELIPYWEVAEVDGFALALALETLVEVEA